MPSSDSLPLPLPLPLTETPLPRESGKLIASKSQDVTIHQDGVTTVANMVLESLKKNEYSIKMWKQHDLHPKQMTKETVDWIFVVDTLNFSFWSETNDKRFLVDYQGEKHSGYWALCAAINRALDEDIPITSASYFSCMTMKQLRHIFRSSTDTDIPLLEKRLKHLHEAGKVLLEKFEGSFANCISQCGQSASKLLQLVTENFPSYRDVATIDGAPVSLYKRAQILIADIWACFEGQGFGNFTDIKVLTMFADYRVPQVLNYFGVLKYSANLREILESGRLFTPGERLEVEIRGCSIWSVELIHEELQRLMDEEGALSDLSLNSIIIDFYLWDYSKDHWQEMKHLPIHRIRSTFY
ncbi:queuosine salvage protein-like isoform X2 [Asterias rubens]|uniref:queuosine salvage protein-like isoform X1 n=1 Tax=Asterias rubens TaxID=7604 RepID=UPI001455B8D0|nr:queuosine salvage protein-like isoform X1 [Asterias rubens]XP_033647355.1 queuosine salvage protein-like isoform X1 [Asterias rubens]XP_033647356.1 queuosine salvage protein-like isoform X1 [Asterias rubens]XP_033647357.1 queuosine salvage protein-like isoform X2 [Asterias rubens]